jgi:galactitol-specific phosphotransferase system IIC component
MHAARQTKAAESTQKMMAFFTVLAAIGLVAGLILGIVAAVELHHAFDTTSTTAFDFSTP